MKTIFYLLLFSLTIVACDQKKKPDVNPSAPVVKNDSIQSVPAVNPAPLDTTHTEVELSKLEREDLDNLKARLEQLSREFETVQAQYNAIAHAYIKSDDIAQYYNFSYKDGVIKVIIPNKK